MNHLPNSDCMVEEDLNNRVASFGDKTNFSIIHLNIWSSMRSWIILIYCWEILICSSLIDVSETWPTDCTAELVNITGYKVVSNHGKSKTGGVGIYLQNGLEYRSRCNWVTFFGSYFSPRKKKNIGVGCTYRPSSQNTAMFIDKFNNILSLISKDDNLPIVMWWEALT